MMTEMVREWGRILSLVPVATEAVRLLRLTTTAEARYQNLYKYLGVLGMVPPDLANTNFPNLYNLLKFHCEGMKTMENFVYSSNITPTVPLPILKKAMKGTGSASLVSEEQFAQLQTVGLFQDRTYEDLVDTARVSLGRRRRRRIEESSEEEDDQILRICKKWLQHRCTVAIDLNLYLSITWNRL